ncbi:MAG: hypothetical protein CXZ00_01395 [Acidobacteria bacterium]|nr:MAG: hypothetical protein CXZ00_01395 [Acidobacteriota bacterium]
MALVWMVECKICAQRFPVLPRKAVKGKSTDSLVPHSGAGRFECPHCHELQDYSTDDFIPGEGHIVPSPKPE